MFLVCGEALFDVFMTGRSGPAIDFQARLGGSPYNVAVGLARLGAQVGFLGGISTDVLGREIAAALAREGVNLRYVAHKAERTTLSLVALNETGVPAYTFYGEGNADRALTAADLPVALEGVTALHFGSYSLVRDPAAAALLALARRESGRRLISLDPNVRPTVAPDLDLWRARLADWVALAGMVKVSAEDLELLYPAEPPAAVAARWLTLGPALVIVTNGGEGATAFTARHTVAVAAPRVPVADTVGAGDSFQAALLYKTAGWTTSDLADLTPAALHAVLTFAVAAGAIACTRPGADLPRLADIEGALM